MTARQERFCQEFIASGNATQSAIKAGYSDKNAKRCMFPKGREKTEVI